MCKKASRHLNVLKRIGINLCRFGKLNIYITHSSCQIIIIALSSGNTKKIEKIQERLFRIIYQDFKFGYDTFLVNLDNLHKSQTTESNSTRGF